MEAGTPPPPKAAPRKPKPNGGSGGDRTERSGQAQSPTDHIAGAPTDPHPHIFTRVNHLPLEGADRNAAQVCWDGPR